MNVGWNLPPLDNADPNGAPPPAPGFIPSYPPPPGPSPSAATLPPGILPIPVQAIIPPNPSQPHWQPGSEGHLPPNALIGGKDVDGESLYIGRARYGGGLIPGKFKPRHKGCYVGHGGKEHLVKHYEVLSNMPHEWKESRKDEIPQGALEAGYSETGEKLYIGRIKHKGSMCLGKVHPSHKCLYIVFGGKEIAYKAYQILVPSKECN